MITPRSNDVLFGRGAAIMGHPGNRRLRSMVERQKKAFVEATKRKEKRKIATDIIREIQALEPSGRFLMEAIMEDPRGKEGGDDKTHGHASVASNGVNASVLAKAWVCVEPDKALTKVMHRLREKDAGFGNGVGSHMEMQNKQNQLVEHEKVVEHPPETRSAQVVFSPAQLPQLLTTVQHPPETKSAKDFPPAQLQQLLINQPIVPNVAAMQSEIFSNQPPDLLRQSGCFDQFSPQAHMHAESEVFNNTSGDLERRCSPIRGDVEGVLSFLNFALQNQGPELGGSIDRGYADERHFRH